MILPAAANAQPRLRPRRLPVSKAKVALRRRHRSLPASFLSGFAALAVCAPVAGLAAEEPKCAPGPVRLRLLRGPYLQLPTATGITIRWRTSLPEVGQVTYGPTPDNLSMTAREASATTEHSLTLAGLEPDTRYHYAISGADPTKRLAGGDPETYFVTSPRSGTARPTRLWIYGDGGYANTTLREVRDAYLRAAADRPADRWFWLGDNAYYDGTDAEHQPIFDLHQDLLRRLPLWPVLGNHETYGNPEHPAFEAIFDLPARGEAGGIPSGTERYYAFDHGDAHFVVLDSMTAARTPDGPMAAWLAADLAANTRTWVIAMFHHPPYSRGTHDSDAFEMAEMRTNINPILEKHGADLVLSGHSHGYERTSLIDGHYGPAWTMTPAMKKDPGTGRLGESGPYAKPARVGTSGGAAQNANRGTVYAVAGGASLGMARPFDHPATVVGWRRAGSLLVDIEGTRLESRFVPAGTEPGDEDAFVISKAGPVPRPNQPPTAAVVTDVTTAKAPATINVTVLAADPDGRVAKVELLSLGKVLASWTAPPYAFAWRNVLPAAPFEVAPRSGHVLVARVTDDRHGVTLSPGVEVVVTTNNLPPRVQINLDRPSYTAPADILVEATAEDDDGMVRTVELLDGSTSLATLMRPPFRFAWRNVPAGTYPLQATAIDDSGNTVVTYRNVAVAPAFDPPCPSDAGSGRDAGAARPRHDGGDDLASDGGAGCACGMAGARRGAAPLLALALAFAGRAIVRAKPPRRPR